MCFITDNLFKVCVMQLRQNFVFNICKPSCSIKIELIYLGSNSLEAKLNNLSGDQALLYAIVEGCLKHRQLFVYVA